MSIPTSVCNNLHIVDFDPTHSTFLGYLGAKRYTALRQDSTKPCLARWKIISERVQEIINQMAKQNGSSHPTPKEDKNIKIVLSWDDGASASPLEKTMVIPYTYLFHARELPPQFHLKNEKDPRLHSKQFLREASKWAIQKIYKDLELPIPEINLQFLETGISSMKEYLLLSLKPQHYKQAIDFVLSHEVGHLYDRFYRPSPPPSNWKSKAISALSLPLIGGAFNKYGTEGAVITAISLLYAAALGVKLKERLLKPPENHYKKYVREESYQYLNEQSADKLALRAFPENARGGIHFFETLAKLQKLNCPDLLPEELDPDHPTPAERIHFLRSSGKALPPIFKPF